MATLDRYDQHPSAIVDYPINNLGLAAGVTLTNVATSVSPAGPVVSGTINGTDVIVRVSSPTAAILYQIEAVITASTGEKRVKEFEVMGVNN